MKRDQPPDDAAIDAWWKAILAGGVAEPHPVHGDDLKISIRHGVLRLAGTLAGEADKQELLATARDYVGHGIDKVDASHLKVFRRQDTPGILEQTLVAAFANREVAEIARRHLVDIRRLKAKQVEILDCDHADRASRLLPADFIGDVQKAFKAGEAVLILRVDETEAFKAREMLAEDTRSHWTVATPPTAVVKGNV